MKLWQTPNPKPFKVQVRYMGFWLTLKRTRTINGAYDFARYHVSMPGTYRIVSGNYIHAWRTPDHYLPEAPEQD